VYYCLYLQSEATFNAKLAMLMQYALFTVMFWCIFSDWHALTVFWW